MTLSSKPNMNIGQKDSLHLANQVKQGDALLTITFRCPPETYPAANRLGKLLSYTKEKWRVHILTAAEKANLGEEVGIDIITAWYPRSVLKMINRLKLGKLSTLLIWPDLHIFWVPPATLKALRLVKQLQPKAIIVFIMPYSTAFVGVFLKWLTGLPLIINLGDSPTCTDIHSNHPSWVHYKLAFRLENFLVRQSDAMIYVSQHNLDRVKARQPKSQYSKFYLIRGGADPLDFDSSQAFQNTNQDTLEIIYTGGMSGWRNCLKESSQEVSFGKKLFRAWQSLGKYEAYQSDRRSSSPIFLGQAIQAVEAKHPEWTGKIKLNIYGNTFDESVVQQVLEEYELTDIVSVFEPVPNAKAIQLARQADILFMTLPDRPDNSAGGRISLKTYEYLLNDRPILAAVPPGENWDYLHDKPGVWLAKPTDVNALSCALEEIASAKFSGSLSTFDRKYLHSTLSYKYKAEELENVLRIVIDRNDSKAKK